MQEHANRTGALGSVPRAQPNHCDNLPAGRVPSARNPIRPADGDPQRWLLERRSTCSKPPLWDCDANMISNSERRRPLHRDVNHGFAETFTQKARRHERMHSDPWITARRLDACHHFPTPSKLIPRRTDARCGSRDPRLAPPPVCPRAPARSSQSGPAQWACYAATARRGPAHRCGCGSPVPAS